MSPADAPEAVAPRHPAPSGAGAPPGEGPPVALVTGAGRRIGAHIARTLAAAGADVVVHHHTSGSDAEGVVRAIRSTGAMAWAVQADLGDPDAAAALVPRAAAAAGRPVTWLVNNASMFPRATAEDATWPQLEACVRTNAWAPFALTRAVAAQGVEAAVVDILDTRLADLDPHHVAYHLSKATLAAASQAAARVWAPRVRVNAVSPGPILEPVDREVDAQYMARLARLMPLRRTPGPDEVAAAVLYLLQAHGVTGEVIHVDGGRHLGRPIED